MAKNRPVENENTGELPIVMGMNMGVLILILLIPTMAVMVAYQALGPMIWASVIYDTQLSKIDAQAKEAKATEKPKKLAEEKELKEAKARYDDNSTVFMLIGLAGVVVFGGLLFNAFKLIIGGELWPISTAAFSVSAGLLILVAGVLGWGGVFTYIAAALGIAIGAWVPTPKAQVLLGLSEMPDPDSKDEGMLISERKKKNKAAKPKGQAG